MIRILLLEDSTDDAGRIEQELRAAGLAYEVRRVETREQFVAALREFAPDVVLADLSLPTFTGLAALRHARGLAPTMPFILVTGMQSEEVAVECMKEGANDYVLKSGLKRLPPALLNALRSAAAEQARAQAQAALRHSEEQYRHIAENTLDLVCLLDEEQRFIYASPSFQLVLGHAPASLLGTEVFRLVYAADVGAVKQSFAAARLHRLARRAELRFKQADGAWRQFESVASWSLNEPEHAPRLVMICRDLEERRRAETEIQNLAAFPRHNPNPVLAFAADGALTYFNEAAMGMARSLDREHPADILPLTTAAAVAECLVHPRERLAKQTVQAGRTIHWSFFAVQGSPAVHCYAEEITERLRLEGQVRQAQRMESIGQLAAGVAHDFNNLLTIIQGHIGLLQALPGLADEADGSLTEMVGAADRAANLTRQLLTFSRKQVLQPELLDLNQVLRDVAVMLHRLLGEHVSLALEYAPQLPSVHADPGMIEQIIINLAVNARDAMPQGGGLRVSLASVEVDAAHASRLPEARAGSFVCLTATDAGCGMDAATLQRVFEPFFTTKAPGKGTGMGLATVYGIVKQHEGWIEVTSRVGHGSTFQVYLPASFKPLVETGTAAEAAPPRGGGELILVVEDEPALRQLVRSILTRFGYRVLEAVSGVHALQVWEKHAAEIDLVLTDMMMPGGILGRELAQQLLAQRPELKVIYTTGYSLDVLGDDLTVREGVNFLQKPYHPPTLVRAIRTCLDTDLDVLAEPARR